VKRSGFLLYEKSFWSILVPIKKRLHFFRIACFCQRELRTMTTPFFCASTSAASAFLCTLPFPMPAFLDAKTAFPEAGPNQAGCRADDRRRQAADA